MKLCQKGCSGCHKKAQNVVKVISHDVDDVVNMKWSDWMAVKGMSGALYGQSSQLTDLSVVCTASNRKALWKAAPNAFVKKYIVSKKCL